MNYPFKNKNEEFLIKELIQFTLHAGLLTRNKEYPVYRNDDSSDTDKTQLKNDIKEFLLNYLYEFELKEITENIHIRKIVELSNQISEKHKHILKNNRFRIGISQKIVNLFLKYMWSINKIQKPFHCPFDSIIKQKLLIIRKDLSLPDWTVYDDIQVYLKYVSIVREIAIKENLTIAEWELFNWP